MANGRSGQVVEVSVVLGAAGGSTELDPGDGGEDVDSEGWYSHSDNLIWLKEELWRQIGGCKPEFANGLRDLGGIPWVRGDPHV